MYRAVALTFPLACAGLGGIRGWNSYDSYNGAANESMLVASANYMATTLAQFGYTHVVVDGGWYQDTYDPNGRPYPRHDFYPSAGMPNSGVGFKPIADAVHAVGLKFGVWSVRGIPIVAVEGNWPIAGSNFTAAQAARYDQNCSWEHSAVGILPNEAGRAYYRSVAQWYASQGIDFVKIDCMVRDQGGLYTEDFSVYATEMAALGITVSVSPGTSMNVDNATYIAGLGLAEQYRVTQDMWDCWDGDSAGGYPTCVKSKLDVLPQYAPVIGLNGAFPDLDMLPLGQTYHQSARGGGPKGPASWTNLTHDEQTTLMTLACVTRAPLMFGGILPIDTTQAEGQWTLSLITSPEVLAVQNGSVANVPVAATGSAGSNAHAWMATPGATAQPPGSKAIGGSYLALFNADDVTGSVSVDLTTTGLPQPTASRCVRDLWGRAIANGVTISASGVLTSSNINAHGAAMLWLGPAGSGNDACTW